MAVEFVMPKLGLTMESGTIVSWLVEDGAQVEPGQAVLLIETDKVESEVEAIGPGLLHRTGEVGQEYPCGAPIGWLLAPGEAPPAVVLVSGAEAQAAASTTTDRAAPGASTSPAQPSVAAPNGSASGTILATTGIGGRLMASPNARRVAAERGIDLRTIAGTGVGGRITSEDVPSAPPPTTPVPAIAPARPSTRVGSTLATAAARQLADLLGVDLGTIVPASVDPRVTREDVAAHVRGLLAERGSGQAKSDTVPHLPPPPTTLPLPLQEPSSVVPMTGMRGMIAERMSASLRSMAQLTLTIDVEMNGVVADRDRRRSEGGPETVVPGFTDYVIAATAAALVEHPVLNSQITDAGVALLPTVNIGMAVALDEGLIVPVIHNTPSLDLDDLAATSSRLAAAARDGKLKLPDLEGGTFSVTALGMFGVDAFTPIINAPNTAILGVGRLRDDVAWAGDGSPHRSTRLTLSLTWDHRAFDGAPAAAFAGSVKLNLEAYR